MTPPPPSPSRRDIQGLRALAVVAVILGHVVGWPRGGFVGVDVFFVVSGFLITGLLLHELADTGRIRLRTFFARRIRRILPAALLVLVVVTAAAFAIFSRSRADQTLWDAVASAGLVANWRFAWQGTDYFSASDAVSPLQHFWSLSVEEQFYLVWPLLLLVLVLLVPAARRGATTARGVVAAAAVVVTAASAAVALLQTPAAPTVAYFSTATRAGELGAGALVAVAAPLLARMPRILGAAVQWLGLAGVLAAFFVIDPASPFPAPWAALPVGATALVLAGGVAGDPRHRHLFVLTNPLGVGIGNASYSLYLWHFPVLVFAAALLPAGTARTGIVLVATVVLALVTFFGLEQPLRRSPWLRGRGERMPAPAASLARAEPETPPAPRAEVAVVPRASAAASVRSTRPAGWTPGQRYYPGQRPRPAEVRGGDAPSGRSDAAPMTHPRPEPPSGAPDVPQTTAWTAWRARFRGQIGFSAAGLGIGAVVIVLLLQTAYGSPVLGPIAPPEAAASAVPAEDPTAAVQAELAAAVAATQWPTLRPSLDEVMARSSSANPARDCFAPEVAPDPGRCTWGSEDAPRHMYLVGDSTAMAYAPAFTKIAEGSGGAWRVTTVGLYGCRFTDVLVQNPDAAVMAACAQRKLDVRTMLAADPADLVVVSNAYTLGRTVDGRDLPAEALIAATANEMGAYGAPGRVVYLAPPPHGVDLAQCYTSVSGPGNCLSAIDQTWRDMQAAAEATAAASGDLALSSLPFTCWQDACPAFAGELPVRYDATHFTVPYAEHIAPVLAWDLAALGLL